MNQPIAYARLDVFFPDGRLESFNLAEDSVSVGRAEGNNVSLDTDNISRYHFSLTRSGDDVSITDLGSANGTYVDGVRLPQNEERLLGDTEEITVGPLRIIYRARDVSRTMPLMVVPDDTQESVSKPSLFDAFLDTYALDVWPAASSSTELTMIHRGKTEALYSVQMDGLPPQWVRITRPRLSMSPDEVAQVLINIKPPRRSNVQPAQYTAQIHIALEDEDNSEPVRRTIQMVVQLQGYYGFGMSLAQQRVAAGDGFRLYLHNQGSLPLPMVLSAQSDIGEVSLMPSQVTIEPGQRVPVRGRFDADRPLLGNESEATFRVIARAQNNAGFTIATSGSVVVAARLRLWQIVSLLGVLVAIGSIVLAAAITLLSPAPADPQILSLLAAPPTVRSGETAELTWQAEDVDRFELLVDGVTIAELDGDARDYAFDTTGYVRGVQFMLMGFAGDESTDARLDLAIEPDITITRFEVTPPRLVQYTLQTIDIAWEVSNASSVRIEGLENFTTTIQQTEFDDSSGIMRAIPGFARNATLELSLTASDDAGNTVEKLLVIDAIQPTCTAIDNTTLYAGPDTTFQSVGTVTAGTSVAVDAQDVGGGWLRVRQVQVGGSPSWAQADQLRCASFFDPTSLQQIASGPLSTPAITPTTPGNAPPPVTPLVTPNPGAQSGTLVQPLVTSTTAPRSGAVTLVASPTRLRTAQPAFVTATP